MTNEEALKNCKMFINTYDLFNEDRYSIEKAMEALEKQIPKKSEKDPFTVILTCPNCRKQLRTYVERENCWFNGYERVSLHQAHCEECGQAINWEE